MRILIKARNMNYLISQLMCSRIHHTIMQCIIQSGSGHFYKKILNLTYYKSLNQIWCCRLHEDKLCLIRAPCMNQAKCINLLTWFCFMSHTLDVYQEDPNLNTWLPFEQDCCKKKCWWFLTYPNIFYSKRLMWALHNGSDFQALF
jgi:hypothetical protein